MWMTAWLWLACGGKPAADRDAYVTAMRAAPEAMAAAGAPIADEALAGECLAVAAAAVAPTDLAAADAVCTGIPHEGWQAECWFLIADAAALVGDPARQRCDKSVLYAERCRQHAANREIDATDRATAVGEEAALREVVARIVGAYEPHLHGRDLDVLVDSSLAQQLMKRWRPAPFRVADCGAASARVCEMAYAAVVFEDTREGVDRRVCAGAITSAAVAKAGGVGWEGDEAIPLRVWKETCKRP